MYRRCLLLLRLRCMASNRNLFDFNSASPKILGVSAVWLTIEEGMLFYRILVGPNPSIHSSTFSFCVFFSGLEWTWATIQQHHPTSVFSTRESIILSCRFFMHGRLWSVSSLSVCACVFVCVSYLVLCLLFSLCFGFLCTFFVCFVFFISKEGEKTKDCR
jgi:hypothetical protein